MSEWHGYVLVALRAGFTLTAAQKGQVRATVRGLAIAELRQPYRMFQTRLSLDGHSAIYEAVWDRERVSPGEVITAVAGALGVPPDDLAGGITYQLFADGGSWEESRQAALAYLDAHRSAWES
jgi:hypothetical protein